MPPPATNEEFFDLVQKSGVADSPKVKTYFDKLRSSSAMPSEPRRLAGMMVRDGLLTYFQAEQLIQGKWKRFSIGKYKVLERLGSGGMGQVFLCEHKLMRRRVAVKVLPTAKAQESSSLERFYREARAAAALDHPNLVRAYDIDSDDGLHFLVMEFVDGRNLQDLVNLSGPLDIQRACHYIYGTAIGLQYAHEMGIIHRDIKPANILIDRNGLVKVLDMGLARFFLDEDDGLTRKHDETVLGTADYLAPEQALDSHSVDIRADIYSLGTTFYFLLTGKSPFPEGTVTQKLLFHQTREPRAIQELRPEVPEELTEIVRKMMAKIPDHRFQSPGEVMLALQPWVQVPIPPPSEKELPKLSPAAAGNPNTTARQNTNQMLTGGSMISVSQSLSPNSTNSGIPVIQMSSPSSSQGSMAVIPLPANYQAKMATVSAQPSAGVWESLAAETTTAQASDTNPANPGTTKQIPLLNRVPTRQTTSSRLSPRTLLIALACLGGLALLGTSAVLLSGMFRRTTVADTTGPRKIYVSKGTAPEGTTVYPTLKMALAKASPGDNILLLDERIEEALSLNAKSRTNLKDVTIESGNPQHRTVWTAPVGSRVRALAEIQGIDKMTLRGITFDGEGRADTCISIQGSTSAITIEDVTVQGAIVAPIRIASANAPDEPLTFHRVRAIVEKGAYTAFLISGQQRQPVSHVRLQDCRAEGPGGIGVQLDGPVFGIDIRGCRFFNLNEGIQFGGTYATTDRVGVQIRNNTFHTVTETALMLAETTMPINAEVSVQDNYFAKTKAIAQSPDGKWVGMKILDNAQDTLTKQGNVPIKAVVIDKDGIPPPNPNDDASFLRYPKDSPLTYVPSVSRSMGASVNGN